MSCSKAITICAALALAGCDNPAAELSGRIGPAMVERVDSLLAQGHRSFTVNRCEGGNVLLAGLIAGKLNRAGASLTADGRCDSACAILLQGVHSRDVTPDAVVRTHQAYFQHQPSPADNPRMLSRAEIMR